MLHIIFYAHVHACDSNCIEEALRTSQYDCILSWISVHHLN